MVERKRQPAGETADGYRDVVAQTGPALRIVRCVADLQYVAQHRGGSGRWPWRAFWFFTTREGAARLSGDLRSAAIALFAVAEGAGAGVSASRASDPQAAENAAPAPLATAQ